MNLGVLIIVIALLGYFSNYLNWKYLNNFVIRFLYYLGTLIHELSHVIFCFLTGAKVKKISIFSKEPKVVFLEPRFPFLGKVLISLGPIIGGLGFLFLINRFCLSNYFVIPDINGLKDIIPALMSIVSSFNFLEWQTWLLILLSFNMGAMIGPSFQDLKNIWPALIILLFIKSQILVNLSLIVVVLICLNIILQGIVILVTFLIKRIA